MNTGSLLVETARERNHWFPESYLKNNNNNPTNVSKDILRYGLHLQKSAQISVKSQKDNIPT